jgi:hypothetical protein
MEKSVILQAIRESFVTDIYECELLLSEFPSLEGCSVEEMEKIISEGDLNGDEHNRLWEMIYDNEVDGDRENEEWEFEIVPPESAYRKH